MTSLYCSSIILKLIPSMINMYFSIMKNSWLLLKKMEGNILTIILIINTLKTRRTWFLLKLNRTHTGLKFKKNWSFPVACSTFLTVDIFIIDYGHLYAANITELFKACVIMCIKRSNSRKINFWKHFSHILLKRKDDSTVSVINMR